MIKNLNANSDGSTCYDGVNSNCAKYGHLYTWESAQRACRSLGDGWRVPTDDEWRQLARHYGGIFDDSRDSGRTAYKELLAGGRSGFNVVLGGNRDVDGKYARAEAHGFYWTATDSGSSAMFYNFARGSVGLFRQLEGDKRMSISVRCVRGKR